MNIKDRLRLLDKSSPPPLQPRPKETDVEAVASILGGEVVENESGNFIRFRHTIPLSSRHGQIELSCTNEINGQTLAILSKKSVHETFDLSTALYIDTETTGLAGGTGTYVFLIGAGYIRENDFIIEQLFLPRLACEQAMLEYLSELISNHKGVVSFNGKSFDVPLLATRFIANRLQTTLDMHEHLDLLHAARRIWKSDFGDCRLGTLEASLMGFERFEDIPGEEIPYIYMEFLRYGKTERLTPVLQHNKLDILSLLALVILLSEKIDHAECESLPAKQAGRLAKLHEQTKSFAKASEIFVYLGEQKNLGDNEKVEYLLSYGRVQKKRGCFDEAIATWKQATGYGSLAIEAYVELAKYYEHREKSPAEALHFTQKAISIIEAKLSLTSLEESRALWDQYGELRHRAKRLFRRVDKSSPNMKGRQ
jgi:uncharacterized protein YprB with RNaseH-like and TPR domain